MDPPLHHQCETIQQDETNPVSEIAIQGAEAGPTTPLLSDTGKSQWRGDRDPQERRRAAGQEPLLQVQTAAGQEGAAASRRTSG